MTSTTPFKDILCHHIQTAEQNLACKPLREYIAFVTSLQVTDRTQATTTLSLSFFGLRPE